MTFPQIVDFEKCPRYFYLRQIEQASLPVDDPTAGKRASDNESDKSRFFKNNDLDAQQKQKLILVSKSLKIVSEIDVVTEDSGDLVILQSENGLPNFDHEGAIEDSLEIGFKALILKEHGYQISRSIVHFPASDQTFEKSINGKLLERVKALIFEAQSCAERSIVPLPLDASPECGTCSLVSVCLPDEVNASLQYQSSVDRQLLLFDTGEWLSLETKGQHREPVRQLVSSRDEQRPLYLNTSGISVGKTGELLVVKEKKKIIQQVRLREISQVNLLGAIQISTQCVQTLMNLGIPLLYFSTGGWFYGMTESVGAKNILWRIEQHKSYASEKFCLSFARSIVYSKIFNQRTLLMRNHSHPPANVLSHLKKIATELEQAQTMHQLLGQEGYAAKLYFKEFAGMIKADTELPNQEQGTAEYQNVFTFKGRNRRPPRDGINALLSFGYSLLVKEMTIACRGIGLDPYLGFYHQPRAGRASLALDLMEPFRPLIVDSVVIKSINNRILKPGDFTSVGNAVNLKDLGRKKFIHCFESRMNELVTHPLYGYRVSYRRIMEIQTRLLARLLMGELREYPEFVTR